MAAKIYFITGQVIARETSQGISALKVEAWDNGVRGPKRLTQVQTDDDGRFSISLDLKKLGYDSPPELSFKIFQEEKLLESTESTVLWNSNTQESITIKIKTAKPRPAGKDRITSTQVFKGVDFFQKSDFNGVIRQYQAKTGTSMGYLADMFTNTFSKMDLKPVGLTGTKHTDILRSDVSVARDNLAEKNIAVTEVLPYNPALDKGSIKDLTAMPASIKPGEKVRLYEENGKVRYYTIVKDIDPASDEVVKHLQNQVR